MTIFDKKQLADFEKHYRTHFVNSLLGPKPTNLVGTKSKDGAENVAIFSSLVHLGAHPPLLGFILRPLTERSHTYNNIIKSGVFTINQVTRSNFKKAHFSAAKFDDQVSEFDALNLKPSYYNNFEAPFVDDSKVQIAMKFVEEMFIKVNNTRLIIGEIEFVRLNEGSINEQGIIDPIMNESIAVSGLESYYSPQFEEKFYYPQVGNLPEEFQNKNL